MLSSHTPPSRIGECRYCTAHVSAGARGPVPNCCLACRRQYKAEWARGKERKPARRAENGKTERAVRRREKLGISGIGEIVCCADCQIRFVKTSSNRLRCDPCRVIAIARRQREKVRRRSPQYCADIRARSRVANRCLYQSSPAFALKQRMGAAFSRALGKGKAGRSWREFVPYSLSDLMTHLERQFLPGMTWDNRGAWHVDHITPLSSFTYSSPDDPEFRAAWKLSNLRPLWATDNLRKSDTRTHLL